MHDLYTWLFRLALPLMLFYLWWRGRADTAYRKRWRERFGSVISHQGTEKYADGAVRIWIHSASVGETLATIPLIKTLAARHP